VIVPSIVSFQKHTFSGSIPSSPQKAFKNHTACSKEKKLTEGRKK